MMKKSKLSIGLVTSFIGALALTACNETPAVTPSEKSIVEFIGYNSDTDKIEIDTDTFYREYGQSDEGTTKFYNAVLEALIRYDYEPLSKEHSNLRAYSELQDEAEGKVQIQERAASDNQATNGTTYEEEWDKILESFDCESREDLYEHFLYELEKDAIYEWYYKEHNTTTIDSQDSSKNVYSLQDQYLGVDKNWGAVLQGEGKEYQSVYPYHIYHVLVKLDASADDYSRATLTSGQAEKLWLVVRQLMDSSYSFEDVAFDLSDDGSASDYGDVGMMSTETNFYNEFKLGIYAYDTLFSGLNKNDDSTLGNAVKKAVALDNRLVEYDVTEEVGTGVKKSTYVSINEKVEEQMVSAVENAITGYLFDYTPEGKPTKELTESEIQTAYASKDTYLNMPIIPYDVFRLIGESAKEEKAGGTVTPESGDVALPRNVYFNQFLNFRSPFLISSEDIDISAPADAKGNKVNKVFHDFTKKEGARPLKLDSNFVYGTEVDNYAPALSTEEKNNGILTDGAGNVIIGVRSSAGIHFMVMKKSVYYNTNLSVYKAQGNPETGHPMTLQDYYDPEAATGKDEPQTYVNTVDYLDSTTYQTRVDKLKNKYKGKDSEDVYDAAFDYRVYELLLAELGEKVVFFDEQNNETSSFVRSNIAKKIALLREKQRLDNSDNIEAKWVEYIKMLEKQNMERTFRGMLKTTCAFNFSSAAHKADYKKGGACYVEQ